LKLERNEPAKRARERSPTHAGKVTFSEKAIAGGGSGAAKEQKNRQLFDRCKREEVKTLFRTLLACLRVSRIVLLQEFTTDSRRKEAKRGRTSHSNRIEFSDLALDKKFCCVFPQKNHGQCRI
jgi:hypothetical protein